MQFISSALTQLHGQIMKLARFMVKNVSNVSIGFTQFTKLQILKFRDFCFIEVIKLKHILTVNFIDEM